MCVWLSWIVFLIISDLALSVQGSWCLDLKHWYWSNLIVLRTCVNFNFERFIWQATGVYSWLYWRHSCRRGFHFSFWVVIAVHFNFFFIIRSRSVWNRINRSLKLMLVMSVEILDSWLACSYCWPRFGANSPDVVAIVNHATRSISNLAYRSAAHSTAACARVIWHSVFPNQKTFASFLELIIPAR